MKNQSYKERKAKFLNDVKSYKNIFGWFMADSVLRFKKEVLLALVTGFLGVTFQVQAIALIFYYANAIEKGKVIRHLGYVVNTRESIWLLFFAGLGVFLSLLLSAWLIYYSRVGILKLMRKYEEVCVKRTFSLIGSGFRDWNLSGKGPQHDSMLLKLVSSDARYSGRALLMFLKAVVPVITVIVATASLFYVSIPLTLAVFVFISVSALFQYRVNIKGARSTSQMEMYSKTVSGEYRNIIRQQRASSVPLSMNSVFFEKLFTSGDIRRFFDAIQWRYRAMDKSRLISDILLAVTIFTIILILGSSIIINGQGWGRLIIYLIALRYMLVSLKQSVTRVTAINRYFVPLKRYFQFIESFERPSDGGGPLSGPYVIEVEAGEIDSEKGRWELKKGGRIGMITPAELNRYNVASLAGSLIGPSGELSHQVLTSLWFVKPSNAVLPLSVRDMFGLPSDYTWEKLGNDTAGSGLWDRMQGQLPQALDKTVSTDSWMKVDRDIRFALNMLSALHSDAQWIFIEESGLRLLSDDICQFFLNRLSDRIVVIVYNGDLAAAGRYNEEIFAVVDQGKTIGLGPAAWVRANETFITGLISKGPGSGVAGGQRDDLDEDLDEEDDDL